MTFDISAMEPRDVNEKWLSYLSFEDRFKNCSVNKSWKSTIETTPFSPRLEPTDLQFSQLHRLGPLIEHIDFHLSFGMPTFDQQMLIAKYCTNLRRLNLGNHSYDQVNAIALSKMIFKNQNS